MKKESLVQEIKKGAHAWNAWRKHKATGDLNLDGIEFNGFNFDHFDLSKISLRNAIIRHCSFKHTDLIASNLEGADLRDNDFSHAKLIAARLNEADLSGSKLTNTNMLTASTMNAKLENIDFRGHDIRSLNLKNISLSGSDLEGQDLSRVDLSNSNLEGVILTNANLFYTILSNANLNHAKLTNANLKGTSFKGATLTGVDLSGFDLQNIDFKGANLSNCDLREANLSKSQLANANITGAKLWRVQSSGWGIPNIECSYVYWDKKGKEKTTYRKHEFERIFAENITIELNYPHRLTANELTTIPIFIEHLAAVNWGTIIRLKSISDVSGGAYVQFVIEEIGTHNPSELKASLQTEANRIQVAQLSLRTNNKLHLDLKEKIAAIREEFWPQLLELAADHEKDQVRNHTVVFMDLKNFSKWHDDELSEKLSLFRGLVKPILKKWSANHPNMEGDSLRVAFRNASIGLACACMMRNVLTAAGFELRIGVELGEVAVVHNEVTDIADLEGMAVSMAARLEATAETGEVLVSHKIRHYTDHKGFFSFTPKRVKLAKGIGTKKQGDEIDCFTVEAIKPLQDML